jgi:hypothetical protein
LQKKAVKKALVKKAIRRRIARKIIANKILSNQAPALNETPPSAPNPEAESGNEPGLSM